MMLQETIDKLQTLITTNRNFSVELGISLKSTTTQVAAKFNEVLTSDLEVINENDNTD